MTSSSANPNKAKTIELRSSDGRSFVVEEAVAAESETIKQMIEDECADSAIPLPNVTSAVLSKVIEYCKRHVDAKTKSRPAYYYRRDPWSEDDDLEAFDAKFVEVGKKTLFDLVLAANYLEIKNLLDLTCRAVGDMIAGASAPEHIRGIFGIKYDFTPEEEEEIRREGRWTTY